MKIRGISSRSVLLTMLGTRIMQTHTPRRDRLWRRCRWKKRLQMHIISGRICESPRRRNALFVMLTRRLHRVEIHRAKCYSYQHHRHLEIRAVTSDCYHQEQGQNVLQDEEDEDNDGGSSRNYLEDLAAMHGIVLRSTDGDDDNLTEEDVKTAAVVTAATGSTDTMKNRRIILVTSPSTMRNERKRIRRRRKHQHPHPHHRLLRVRSQRQKRMRND